MIFYIQAQNPLAYLAKDDIYGLLELNMLTLQNLHLGIKSKEAGEFSL